MRRLAILSLTTALTLAASTASASTILFATLTHDQETPPGGTTPPTTSTGAPRPLAYGTAIFELNDAQTELSMIATIYDIDVTGSQTTDTFDDLVAAHIHVGAPPGVNAPVRWGFFGAPDNDINPDNLLVVPFATGVGGVFTGIWNQPEGNGGTTLTTNLPDILAGLSYLNFHTVQFPGGEIRGQITAPEPATLALLGLAGLAMARRIRRER